MVFHTGGAFLIRVPNQSTARGLYAAQHQRPDWATPEEYATGMQLHNFYLSMTQALAFDYDDAIGKKKAG